MSTVLANTITAVGGGGSTVKVNNDATFISDGGAITNSNLVQGLVKVWVLFDGGASGAASRDSFNVSGMTDSGNRLKPMYGRVQPISFHAFFRIVDSSATTVARLSESRPAIGNSTLARTFPSFTATTAP